MKGLRMVVFGAALGAAVALPLWASEDDTVGQRMKGAAESVGEGIKDGAEATGHAVKEGAEVTGHAVKEGAKKTGEFLGITSSEAARYRANERAEHQMTGKITGINHDSGVVDVQTAAAPLQLRFSPKAVSHLKKGDEITVDLAYAMADVPTNAAGTSEKAYDAPKTSSDFTQSEHWVKGTVSAINHESGVVNVTAEKAGTLTLHFPPADIAHLNTGDHIAVGMAFEKGKHIEKIPTKG